MPLYEYKCQQCGRLTEKRQKFSDPEITQCPHCNGPLERVISAPAISFKGSGWYKDLYSSPKPAASSPSGESSGTTPSTGDTGGGTATPPTPAAPSTASAPATPASAPAKSS